MTAIENNILMWSHYTQEKGFQLSFKSSLLEISLNEKIGEGECFGLFPMNYTSNLNPIDIYDFDSLHIPFFYATNVKSNKWEYEQEWRFLIGKPMMGVPYSKIGLNTTKDFVTSPKNRYTYYDSSLIEQITLGMNFFTAQDFNLEWSEDRRQFIASPKKEKSNWNYQNYKKLLIYMYTNLNKKIIIQGQNMRLMRMEFIFLLEQRRD